MANSTIQSLHQAQYDRGAVVSVTSHAKVRQMSSSMIEYSRKGELAKMRQVYDKGNGEWQFVIVRYQNMILSHHITGII